MQNYKKTHLDVLQSESLRDIVGQVNSINDQRPAPILKEDIVKIFNDGGTWFLIYYK